MNPPVTTDALVEALARHIDGPAFLPAHQDGRYFKVRREDALRRAETFVAGPLAPILAAHQQVTAERDAEKARAARLRAEGEAKDRALKAKAEEQVAYWRERQRAEKCLEDGISEDSQTYTPIGDVAAWQGGYCNGRMSEADWWAKTLQYWPEEAARAATAREG